MKGFVRYFIHDGSVWLTPHYALPAEIPDIIDECRKVAVEAIKESNAAHVVYAVKIYDGEDGALSRVDLYIPGVLLDDDEFDKRTSAETKEHPGCIILASHARK